MTSDDTVPGPVLSGVRLDSRSPVPLHRQLAEALRSLIASGKLTEGTQLPGEVHLATQLRVGRQTVRQALGTLVSEGLLRRRQGSGTVVSNQSLMERPVERFYAFVWEQRARGADYFSRVLERSVIGADASIAQRLDLAPGAPVERIVLLRTADGEPWGLETATLPRELSLVLSRQVLERESIYDVLEQKTDVRVTRAREWLRAVNLGPAEAAHLKVDPGSAAFRVERVTWSDRRPLEVRYSLLRADRYMYVVDLPNPHRYSENMG